MDTDSPKWPASIPCNTCGGERNHALRAKYYAEGPMDATDDDGIPLAFDLFEILQCLGCNAVTIRRTKWNGSRYYVDSEDGGFIYSDESITYLPGRMARARPPWLSSLPKAVESVLGEVYSALDVGALTLAAIGVRTIIDMVALKAVGDLGTFREKLEALEKGGWLGSLDRRRVEVVADAGSAAAHRGFRATPTSIGHMMEVVEHLLKATYVLDLQTKVLKRSTPKRQRSAKAKPSTPGR